MLTNGLHVVVAVLVAIIATRVIRWVAARISRHLAQGDNSDAVVRSETVKHRQAMADFFCNRDESLYSGTQGLFQCFFHGCKKCDLYSPYRFLFHVTPARLRAPHRGRQQQ